jgi:hypothetical protein
MKVPRRVLRLEKNAAGEAERKKQNPQATDLEKSGAPEPDPRRPNLRAAVQNFRENPLLEEPGNLHLKQQIPVKEQRKELKRGPTGNQKGAKPAHPRPGIKTNESKLSLVLQ